MIDSLHLRKVIHYARHDGLLSTTSLVFNHFKKWILGTLEGSKGYYNLQWWLLQRKYDPDVLTPIWVSPDEISTLTGEYTRRESGHLDYVPYFKPRETSSDSLPYQTKKTVPYGTIKGGNWDRVRADFPKLLMYQGVEERFVEGLDWEETIYFEELQDRFVSQGWSETEANRLAQNRCERLELLYDLMSTQGYRSQRQLNGHPLHEITVAVGRDGEIMYNSEGRHRLSIAKVLGIEAIPVQILVTHEEFQGSIKNARK